MYNSMPTETPSSIEQTAAVLVRLVRQLMAFLEIQEITNKRDQLLSHSHTPLNQLTLDLEVLVKMLLKRNQEEQKGFEQQLQKLENKLRRHAKSQCQMKLFCDYLQEQLQIAQNQKSKLQNEKKMLEIKFNKQLQTLKTQLSHGTVSKLNQTQKCLETARGSLKPTDALTKIKIKLMNLGNLQLQEPQSCINTLRKSIPSPPEELRPLSEPNSQRNSPKNQTITSKSKSKTNLIPKTGYKGRINLKLQLKTDQIKKQTKSKPKLKKNG